MKYLIVGVDPGITTGLCALNLNGKIVEAYSSKKLGLESTIEHITRIGRPVAFACDVANPPLLLKKLAATYSARLVYPKEDMKVGEKQKIVQDAFPEEKSIINLHQRDACAAALFAFRRFYDLFDKIDFILKREGLIGKSDEVKKKLLLGEAESIKDALKEKPEEIMLQTKKRVKELGKPNETTVLKEYIKRQNAVIENMKIDNQRLKNKIDSMTGQLKTCGSPETAKLAEARKRTIESLENNIFKMENMILNLESTIKRKSDELAIVKHSEFIPVKLFDNLSSEQLSVLEESNFGDCLFVKELTVLSSESENKLKSLDIKLIVYERENRPIINDLLKRGFTTIAKHLIDLIEEHNMLFISKDKLAKVMEKMKVIKVEHLIEEHKQRFSK